MKRTHWFSQRLLRSPLTRLSLFSLILHPLSFTLYPSSFILPVLADLASTSAKLHYAAPRLPEDPGEPEGRGRGGAGRIPACKKYQTFTALIPVTQTRTTTSFGGLTTLDHPTFWFYLPEPLMAGMPLKFVLRDRDENPVYEATVQPPTPAGIIRVALPETAAPLQVNQSYRWGVFVQCDPVDPNAIVWLQGSIQRVAMSATAQQQLETAKTPLDRAIVYANHGIWFEALTTLAEEIQQHGVIDRTLADAWTDLLKQGRLSSVSKAAIVSCCMLK